MAIRKTAYETTACAGFVISKISNAVEDAMVGGNLGTTKNNSNVREVNRTASVTPIPTFFHPIAVKAPKGWYDAPVPDGEHFDRLDPSSEKQVIVVDVRSAGKYDEAAYEFRVRNQYEYDFIALYGELNHYWLNDNARLLGSVSHLPVSLYARWMSENISRRFGLNPQDQLSIAILAAFFYLGQFTNDEEPDMRDLQRICGMISKSVFVNGEAILNVIDKRHYIKNIDEFCEVVKEVTGNVRLNDLNKGLLFSILGSTWYGTNAKELAAVAVEFPPAWILMTYTSYVDRSFKNTGLAKMSVRDKKADIDSFIKSLVTLLRHN